jgi:hypothetical protein
LSSSLDGIELFFSQIKHLTETQKGVEDTYGRNKLIIYLSNYVRGGGGQKATAETDII